jgi:ABC-2 type transport system permease protein
VRAAVHAEWTKMRTIASPGLLLLAATALAVALSVAVASAVNCPAAGCALDPARISLTGVQLGQAVIAVLAVLAVGNEYGTGMMHTSLAAVPRRATMLTAKAAVVTAGALAAGTVTALSCVLAGRLLLPGNGFTAAHGFPPLSLSDGPTLRAAGGSVLYLALIALLSLGVATMVRDSTTAIGIVLGLLFLFPILINVVTDPDWQRHLRQISPSGAGLAVQDTIGLRDLPIGPWAGLGVLAAWAAAALLAGGALLRLGDA